MWIPTLLCLLSMANLLDVSGQASITTYNNENISALLKNLLTNYEPGVPPPRGRNVYNIAVYFDMKVNKMMEYDQATGILRLSVWYRLYWNDTRLRYSGADWFGDGWDAEKNDLVVDSDAIWKPYVVPYYSIDTDNDAHFGPARVQIKDEQMLKVKGYNVAWTRNALLNLHCTASLKDFPFDKEMCSMKVGSWEEKDSFTLLNLKSSEELKTIFQETESKDYGIDSQEWLIRLSETRYARVEYASGWYDEVWWRFELTRVYHYYVVNAILPMSIVVVLGVMTLWLPDDERLGFATTLLLTIMATTLFTAEKRPATQHDTWMDKFQAWCILMTFMPAFLSALLWWMKEKINGAQSQNEVKSEEQPDIQCASNSTPSQGTSSSSRRSKSGYLIPARFYNNPELINDLRGFFQHTWALIVFSMALSIFTSLPDHVREGEQDSKSEAIRVLETPVVIIGIAGFLVGLFHVFFLVLAYKTRITQK